VLKVDHLTVTYEGFAVISDLSFSVPTGETLAITGPSGIGKSTLLHAICGLTRIRSGAIMVDGTDITNIPTHKRGIGLVSQTADLFPTMNVFDNVHFGLHQLQLPKKERVARVNELLEMVGLPHLSHRDIAGLSGGETRRVALARALAPSPRVLLLDEPLTGLDQDTHATLMHDVIRVLKETTTTALLVTHNASEAQTMAYRILPMTAT
jgi:thiamine transport system ATP-binding protein